MHNYKDNFQSLWTEAGGLITQRTAARILDTSSTTINRHIKKQDLRIFKIDKEPPMVSYAEVMTLSKTKKRRKK